MLRRCIQQLLRNTFISSRTLVASTSPVVCLFRWLINWTLKSDFGRVRHFMTFDRTKLRDSAIFILFWVKGNSSLIFKNIMPHHTIYIYFIMQRYSSDNRFGFSDTENRFATEIESVTNSWWWSWTWINVCCTKRC